jgi:phosphonate transport system ATP-binding protein
MALAVLHGVSVRFGETVALRDVDLTIDAGERVGLLGPSGAGKSTLLGVLGARVPPTTGDAKILGSPADHLRGRAGRAVRRRIGTVHQDLALTDPIRVVHNVNAGRLAEWSTLRALRSLVVPVDRARVVEVLEAVGIPEKIDDLTESLSGGQRQRVAVARLLVQDPDLVLADEPAASLDPELGRLMMRLLADVAATPQRALVVSLHDPSLARSTCDRLVGLRDGAVVFDRPADEIDDATLDEVYRR